MSYKSESMMKILLTLGLLGILPWPAHQVPVGPSFGFLLYPGFDLGLTKPQGILIPMATSEQNVQQSSPQTDQNRISPPGVLKPHGFLQPDTTPTPQTFTPKSVPLQGQMSNFLPFNFPMQVYSVVQQAVITDSDSSEEGKTAQVIYLIPVSVESSNMGVMEGTVPNPDPGHLQVQTTTTSAIVTPAARPEAQQQLRESVGPEMITQRPHSGTETLLDHKLDRGMKPQVSVKHKPFSTVGNIRK